MKNSKKKSLSKNKKFTIIKVLPKNGTISQDDLNRWHEIFRTNSMPPELAMATGEVEVEEFNVPKPGTNTLTLVKVGSDEYAPSVEDLEQWRLIFETASFDPDFKIFTHKDVSVEVIDIGKVIAVE